jgi:hypothetical protein
MRRSRPPSAGVRAGELPVQFEGQALVQLKGLPQAIFDALVESMRLLR